MRAAPLKKGDVINSIRQPVDDRKPYLIHELVVYLYYSTMGRFVPFHEKLQPTMVQPSKDE